MSANDTNRISAALKRYESAWLEGNVDEIVRLWDSDCDEVSYMPGETPLPIIGHAALRKYFTDSAIECLVSFARTGPITILRGGGVVYALCDYDWEFKKRKDGPLIAMRTHATTVLHQRNEEWYFLHMHESVTWQP